MSDTPRTDACALVVSEMAAIPPEIVDADVAREFERELDDARAKLADALIISFIQGAQWWEWQTKGATMWPSDRDLAEAAARERLAKNKLGEPTP